MKRSKNTATQFYVRLATVLCLVALGRVLTLAAPSVDARLLNQISAAPLAATPVVITYDQPPNNADLLLLRSLGIRGGVVLNQLPMVLTAINQTQFNALQSRAEIRSLYANRTFRLFDNKSRQFIGLNALRADNEVTVRTGGLPVSGQGIGVAYVDTGIDATHPDLQFGRNVVQNVLFPLAEAPLNFPAEFVPPIALEDQAFTDAEGGHGTFGAAVTAGTGQASGTFYGGVAPGAKLVGLVAGNDVGLSTFAILQAYNYTLVNQTRYNIRVCNNSFGTTLAEVPYDPFDPINTATRTMHDRNIVVVFAAGNDGDAPNVINPFSIAPWVISVAAGAKQGLGEPAGFSSRGNDNGTGVDVAGQPADPYAPPNLRPDLTGSGVDIKSARSKGPGVTNVAGTLPIFVGANDLTTIPPAFLPFYTTSQGTSFSAPQVSGVVALMLEANPLLTPDEVVTLLRQTATPMPYPERVVGAGYVDAHNAVRAALSLSAVPHPANLFPQPGGPEITDAADDQLGTTAQDIRTADFAYDAAASQFIYTLTLADLSVRTPNMRWTMSSAFGAVEVFVTASVNETSAVSYQYGKITTLATGTRNQERLGATDAGEIRGNQIIIRLALAKVNAAVGANVLNTTSTNTQAQSQILIGTSVTGGLLLNSDSASGADYQVSGQPAPTTQPTGNADRFDERYSGALTVGQSVADMPFVVRHPTLEAKLNFHPGNQTVVFELLDAQQNIVATANDRRLTATGLPNGTYTYRIRGNVTKAVDFTIKSRQER
jgi:serine protease AprX